MHVLKSRKSNRLRHFNYSTNGWYFVTICVNNRENWFGEIKNGEMILNKYGRVVEVQWKGLSFHYKNCILDESIIMPNHIHGVIVINNGVGNGLKPFPTDKKYSLSEIIRGFKTFSSKKINQIATNDIFRWQKSFFDHIIRDETSLQNIRTYIRFNPLKWNTDTDNPKNIS